jgi:hypothetical protein
MSAKTSHQGAEAWEGEGQPVVLSHHSNSLDLSTADFFIIPKVKEQRAHFTLTQGTFKSKLERAIRNIVIEEVAAAYRRWLQ